MTFLSSLNFNWNFCYGMRELFIPSFSHFHFSIPDVFTCLRLPSYPILPKITSIWQGWSPGALPPLNTVSYQVPLFNTRTLNLPEYRLPDNNLSRYIYTPPKTPPAQELTKPKVSGTAKKYALSGGKKVDNSYVSLSKSQATKKAQSDTNLERLSGGRNWSVSDSSFRTDIPYAKKGTGKILDKVSDMIDEKLVITSALGTGQTGNPHVKSGYASHHNAENPKLDIRTNGHGRELAAKLRATGYFSRVSLESDHLDVQIDPSKYEQFSATA